MTTQAHNTKWLPTLTEQRLRGLLDNAGLRYEVRATAGGLPYAAFRTSDAGGEPVGVTAMIREAVLQITAHDLLTAVPVERDLRAADGFNDRWGLGRVYYKAEQGVWEAAEALYLGDTISDSLALIQVLADLADAARLVRDHAAFPLKEVPAMEEFFETQRRRMLPVPNGSTMLDVEGALSQLGLRYRLTDEGQRLLVRLVEGDGHDFLVDIFKTDKRYLHMRARAAHDRAVPDDVTTFQRMQRLNARILIGAVLFAPDPPCMYHHAVLPLTWTRIDAALIGWLIDHAAAATEAVEREIAPV